jgi:hypothetical protein
MFNLFGRVTNNSDANLHLLVFRNCPSAKTEKQQKQAAQNSACMIASCRQQPLNHQLLYAARSVN